MTIDDRFVIDLADVLMVQFECRRCHASVNYPPAQWKPKPLQCPNCAETWWGDSSMELRIVEQLAEAIQALLAHAEKASFRIRLVLEHPD